MLNETLIIHDTKVDALSGDQLSIAERADFSQQLGDSLAESEFNHPITALDLAAHMGKGRNVVFVYHDSGLLLAHILPEIENPNNNTAELRAWYSYQLGFGGAVMREGVQHSKSLGAETVLTSVQERNTKGDKAVRKLGGRPVKSTTSRLTGQPITVFNVTHIGRNSI